MQNWVKKPNKSPNKLSETTLGQESPLPFLLFLCFAPYFLLFPSFLYPYFIIFLSQYFFILYTFPSSLFSFLLTPFSISFHYYFLYLFSSTFAFLCFILSSILNSFSYFPSYFSTSSSIFIFPYLAAHTAYLFTPILMPFALGTNPKVSDSCFARNKNYIRPAGFTAGFTMLRLSPTAASLSPR
jgi:hypothetical protein